jgi:MoaA/NifB/PqqE/SkfB family radical SAM enzyme
LVTGISRNVRSCGTDGWQAWGGGSHPIARPMKKECTQMTPVASLKVLAYRSAVQGGARILPHISERRLLALLRPLINVLEFPEGRAFVERLVIFSRRAIVDCSPQCRNKWVNNFLGNALVLSYPMRQRASRKYGFFPPLLMVMSPTMKCNLRCAGCYSAEYAKSDDMSFDTMVRVVAEAKELGVHFVVISGGEPYTRADLLDLYEAHDDVYFLSFTNGTLIDDRTADRIAELGNVLPCVSVEGFRAETDERRAPGVYEKVLSAMDRLRERGVLFGFSATATRPNNELVVSDEFVDFYESKGCFIGWYFQYMPIGRSPNFDLVPTPEQRNYRRKRMNELRRRKSILLADFWNDGPMTGGCIAGGREYFHVNNKGDVEPCVFTHFAADNVHDVSLVQALGSPLFRAIRKRQPYHHNYLRPCMIIDHPEILRAVVEEGGARPTHPGAEDILKGDLARDIDRTAAEYGEIADREWDSMCAACGRPAGRRARREREPADHDLPGADATPSAG